MAEQLCVGALVGYTQTGVVDLARDGMVDLDVPDGGIDLEVWVEEYLADVDHELLYDPALDGIDDEVTDHQYGFGRMDYEGMFAVFNEHNVTFTGGPHPLASLRMTATEWDDEQRLQRAVAQAAIAVARAAVAGAARIHLADNGVDVELVAHRVGNLLGLRLRTARRRRSSWSTRWMRRRATGSPAGSTTTTPRVDRWAFRLLSRRSSFELTTVAATACRLARCWHAVCVARVPLAVHWHALDIHRSAAVCMRNASQPGRYASDAYALQRTCKPAASAARHGHATHRQDKGT